ncbi:MAG: beta strand repeat-containing protein, partial [Planctomycetales bacterium]
TGLDDSLYEVDEEVVVDITSVTNGVESGTQLVKANLIDDDPEPTVTLAVSPATFVEEGGTATVTATLSAVSGRDTIVNLTYSGAAVHGVDYSGATQIMIPAGQQSASITLTGLDDGLYEHDEQLVVDIASVTNALEDGVQSGTATIVDTPPKVTLSVNPTALAENGGVTTVTATLSELSEFETTIDLAFSGVAVQGTDFSASGTMIVIAAGSLTGSITLTGIDDAIYERNEDIVVDITAVTNGTEDGTQQVTATITDDEAIPSVTLAVDPALIAENGGVATVTATLSGVSAFDTMIDLSFSGKALQGTDYTASATQIVVPAGSLTASVILTAAQDTLYERDEDIVVDISSVTNGDENGVQQVITTIVDDELPPTVTLSRTPATISENGGVSTVTATLSAVSGLDTTIDLAFSGTAGEGTDYTASATQIIIPAGLLTGSIDLTALQDDLFELPETVMVDISGVTNGTESGSQQVTTTITDDDPAPTVTLSRDPIDIAENGGQSVVTATLSAVSGLETVVSLALLGTATVGADYSASAGQIVIPAGQLTGTMILTALQDTLFEGDETVIVDMTSVTNAMELGVQQATVTILDDESAPTAILKVSPATMAENGGQSTITATLSAISGLDTTVILGYTGTAIQGVNYTVSGTQIVIPAGELSASITLTAMLDNVFAKDNTVVVDVTNVINGTELGTQQATVTIVDGDAAPDVTLAVSPSLISETGGTGTITATLSRLSALATTITLGYSGTATSDSDYTASATQIVIPAGQLTGTVNLFSISDTVFEGNETIVVDVTGVTNGTESVPQQVTATIVDDDPAPTVTLSIDPATLSETGGVVTLTATLSVATALKTTVILGFTGTASNGLDYAPSGTQIVIPAGQTSALITLTGLTDTLFEGSESIVVDITSVINAVEQSPQQVSATILDDDPIPSVTVEVTPATISEGGGAATVTATLSAISGLPTTVSLAFTGTATQGIDYSASATQIVIPAGQLSATLTLTPLQDTLDETAESILVDITGVINGIEFGTQQVTTSIIDDDAPFSRVNYLPSTTQYFPPATSFVVSWTGTAGASAYSVYVSDNGGAFTLFVSNTSQTSAVFSGAQLGHTYGFYSVATDVDNQVQPTPTAAQASTTIDVLSELARKTGLEGFYFVNGQSAQVLRNGSRLTFINGAGQTSTGTVTNETQVVATDFNNLQGTFDPIDGSIGFADGTVWQKVRQIDGQWLTSSNRVAGIKQLGTELTFTGGTGAVSAGRFVSATELVATGWGNLTGRLTSNGTRIRWANGTMWDLVPDFQGAWANSSAQPTRVEQLGTTLQFYNRQGQRSAGQFVSQNQVVATDWGNMVGTIQGGTIQWANGTAWAKETLTGSNPDLGGVWDVNGSPTRILQTNNALTFVNRMGQTSAGRFLSPTQVIADDWGGAVGNITGNSLAWVGNGIVWNRIPKLSGPYLTGFNLEAGINQVDRSLTFTDEDGVVTHGGFASQTLVNETDGDLRAGTLSGNQLTWSDRQVWTKLYNLQDSWFVVSTNAPTYIEQSGLRILIIDSTGGIFTGKFNNANSAQLTQQGGAGATVTVNVQTSNALSFGGATWNRAPVTALDTVFADPSLWPFI